MSGVKRIGKLRWSWIERNVPIACVDLLAARRVENEYQLGLIRRDTPHQGQRWCLIGGRITRGERLVDARRRLWADALGDSLPMESLVSSTPLVVEYLPTDLGPGPHDPRKHAIANTYLVSTSGTGRAHGNEALEFRWFSPGALGSLPIGFGQDVVIQELISTLGGQPKG